MPALVNYGNRLGQWADQLVAIVATACASNRSRRRCGNRKSSRRRCGGSSARRIPSALRAPGCPAVHTQAIKFLFDYGVAFAHPRLQVGPVRHRDLAALAVNQSGILQASRRFGGAHAAHAQHVGDQVPASIDLARQRFREGATRVQCAEASVLAPLAVIRSDALPALIAIERSSIEYVARRGPKGLPA